MSRDDDNYCLGSSDLVCAYSVVLRERTAATTLHTENGWLNVLGLDETNSDVTMHVRRPTELPSAIP